MSNKKYLGVALAFVPIVLILITLAIVFNNRDGSVKEENDWTNIADLSDEFMDSYFDGYKEMRRNTDPDNILMVTSKTRPETYGAEKIVEAPNYLYLLSYENAEMRDRAFDRLKADGMVVEKNQTYYLMDGDDTAEVNGSTNSILSWGVFAMGLDQISGEINYMACDPDDVDEDWCVDFSEYVEDDDENDYEVIFPTVTVAVIDTGMDRNAFESHFPDRTLRWWCTGGVECDEGIDDRNEATHGTHVGGTVVEGTPDNVELLAIKATDNPKGVFSGLDIIEAINYAVDEEVDVINMSLGIPIEDPEEMDLTAMENALQAAYELGIVNVASAGNDNNDIPNYPASFTSTISVAALTAIEDENGTIGQLVGYSPLKWEDSNYGSTVDVTAPGDAILGINGLPLSGTSMASPHISAFVANLKTLNNEIVKEDALYIIKNNIDKDLGEEGWDQYYGWGMPFYTDLCSEDDCDKYGALVSRWNPTDDGSGVMFDPSVNFSLRDENITITSENGAPLMMLAEKNGVFSRIVATGTGNTRVFDLEGVDPKSVLHTAFVGDVDLDGSVGVSDSLLIDHSRLPSTDSGYVELTDYQKKIADVNKNGSVNLADSLLIDYSRLPVDDANYRALEW